MLSNNIIRSTFWVLGLCLKTPLHYCAFPCWISVASRGQFGLKILQWLPLSKRPLGVYIVIFWNVKTFRTFGDSLSISSHLYPCSGSWNAWNGCSFLWMNKRFLSYHIVLWHWGYVYAWKPRCCDVTKTLWRQGYAWTPRRRLINLGWTWHH